MTGNSSCSKKRLLFVCYGAGHVNMLVPIILKSLSDDRLDVTVLGLTTAGTVLEYNSIPYLGFKDLVEDSDKEAVKYGEQLSASLPSGGSVCHEETVAYLGLSFYDLIRRHGIEEAQKQYKSKGRQAFLPITIIERLFNRIQPELLVSTNSPRAERAAFLVARERNIPSVCIVGLFARHEVEWIGEENFGSRICVLSESVKQFIQSSGRYEHEVVVTGNPAFDRLARQSLTDEARNFRKKREWENKQVILWASQPEPVNHPFTGVKADSTLPHRVESALLEVAERHADWQIVIRYHPGETVESRNWPKLAYISNSKDDLAILLKSVDVVVTMTSTVGLEGLLLDKPLITIDQSVFREDAPYSEMGLAKGVDDLDKLETAILDALSGRWIAKEKLPDVGFSTERVYKIMLELLY